MTQRFNEHQEDIEDPIAMDLKGEELVASEFRVIVQVFFTTQRSQHGRFCGK